MSSSSPVISARVRVLLGIPLHRFLGVRLADAGDPAAGILLPVEEPALNNVGLLHGGVVTALLDVASYLALLPSLDDGQHAVTHDLFASLIRPVPRGSLLRLRGAVVRQGRAVVFLRAEASVDGVIAATAQVTKTLLTTG